MGFWTKSRLIFNAFRDNTKASIRQVALQTGLSKSSVQRLWQAMVGRNQHPESWFWETEEGRRWFIRFVVAVLYHFGLKRGVGAETISAFFACLHLEQHVGCLPSTLRAVMDKLETRFFRREFPSLFEEVLGQIDGLPRPRKCQAAMMLSV
jgi:hypothetical protein